MTPICIVCNKTNDPLIPINVRHEGRLLFVKHVHPGCYEQNKEWVKKKVHGKNPKYFVMGRRYEQP
jgi:hypothetical protein